MSVNLKNKFLFGFFAIATLMLSSSSFATTTTISSLPYTASQAGTNYSETLFVAGTNLVSATNGIRISGHDIVLNLGNDTLTFGTGSAGSNYGLQFWGDGVYGGYNIKIIGGTILHQPTDTTSMYNLCVTFGGGKNIYFENTNFVIKGYNGHCLERPSSSWGITNVEFNGGRWRSDVTAFSSRCQYDGAVARLFNALQPVTGNDYHFKIHNIVLESSPGQGLIIQGQTYLYNCSLIVDARNDFYTYPSGGVCNSSANSFAVIAQLLGAGSKIYNNVIRAGTNYYGCDGGVLLQMARGTADNPVEIFNNDIELHRGHDAYYWDLNVKAFKSRYANKHVHIYNNRFATLVGNTSESSYGINGTTVDVVSYSDAGSDWPEGRAPDSFLVYENNRIESIALDANFSDTRCVRYALEDSNGYTWTKAGNIWRNNHLITSQIAYQIGGYDNNGECHQILIEGDTVEFSSISFPQFQQYSYYLGFNSHSLNNYARDVVYLNGASDMSFAYQANDGERTLYLQRTFKVYVEGSNSLPVVNAACSVWNKYNNLVFSGLSDSGGMVAGVVNYWKEAEDGPDSSYNTFKIKAAFNSDIASNASFTVGWTPSGGTDTLTLSNTTGTGEWGAGGSLLDTIPPAEVIDLGAVPGDINGSIILSWTAPGDDNNSGQAASYAIRYDTDSITEADWYLATAYPFPPLPSFAGTEESITFNGLTPGQKYFFGLRTSDDAGNHLGIVFTSGFARGIQTPLAAVDSMILNASAGEATLFAERITSYLNIVYEFQLATDFSFTSPITQTVPDQGTAYVSTTFTGLSTELNYYYRIRAVSDDQTVQSAWTQPAAFNLVTGAVNTPPSIPVADAPLNGDTLTTLTPGIIIANSTDAEGDIITYDFEIYDASSINLITFASNITQGNSITSWTVNNGNLSDKTTYNWHARAYDGNLYSDWSDFLSFTIVTLGAGNSSAPLVYAYPNPVHFAQGETATFVLPDDPSNLLIQTVSGETVILRTGVTSGWSWDGKNESGIDVAMGVYLWYVNGNAYKGKIMVKP